MTQRNPSEVVFASAGSGKTYELTSRYLSLLAQGQDPDSLLASTFTRTAAGEILERIVKRLAEACSNPHALAELATSTNHPLTPEHCQAMLDRLLSNLHRANVGTIDSLFTRLAGAFALELGVAPGWRIAEAEADLEIRERALDQTLSQDNPTDEARLIEMFLGNEGRSIRETVLDEITKSLDNVRETGPFLDPWERLRPTITPLTEEDLQGAIDALEQMPLPRNRGDNSNQHWRAARDAMAADAHAAEWEKILGSKLAMMALGHAPDYQRIAPDVAQIKALEPVARHAAAKELWRFYNRSLARRELVLRFDTAYQRLKKQEGLLRFEDLPRLLDEAQVLSDLPELYERLDARTRHVLLDEFQDTSLIQYRLLEPILDEILSQSDGRSVFVVGDAKQSLFGWRNAEPELLASLPQRWTTLASRTLAKSWRSSQVALDAVNDVFENLLTNPAIATEPATKNWTNRFEHHTAAKQLAGCVRMLEAPPQDEETGLEATLRIAADRAQSLSKEHPDASIAIIVRRNKTIRDMVSLLRSRNLQASEEGGSPLTDCAPVVAALSLIHLIDHPTDTASLFHVATSPLADATGLRDFNDLAKTEPILNGIRTQINSQGLARSLARLADNILSRMESGEADRFERLIDLAQEFDASNWTRLDRFLEMVRHRRIESRTAAPIRVMNIHKAKGLEFDAVILPELDQSIEPRSHGILCERQSPLGQVSRACVNPRKFLRQLDPRLAEVYAQSRTRHLEEALSLLYVAMTRARHALELIVQPASKGKEPTHAKILRSAFPSDARTPAQPAQQDAEEPDAQELSSEPTTLYESGNDTWTPSSETDSTESPELFTLNLRHRPTPLPSRLAHRAASDRSDTIRLRDRLQLTPSRAQQRGTLLHRWFEEIEWLDEQGPMDLALIAIARASRASESLIEECLHIFHNALASPEIRSLLKRPKSQAELWRERPFAIRAAQAPGQRLITGRFDRVVIHRAQGVATSAHIIDFKTDSSPTSSNAELAMGYAPQMDAYRTAAARLLDLPPGKVKCSLALLTSATVIDIPMTSQAP